MTNPTLLKRSSHSAPSQKGSIITTQLWLFPSSFWGMWELTCRFQLHKWPRIIITNIWSYLVSLVGSSRQDPVVATASPLSHARMGREKKQLLQRAPASPGSLWSQFRSRSNGHRQRQQRIFFFTLNSLNKQPFTEEHPAAPMLFYNKGPMGRGYTNPAFFPSNNRFHSCFQRSWPFCRILAMLTHAARVPWGV